MASGWRADKELKNEMRELSHQELLELFATALAFLDEGVLLADINGQIIFYNKAASLLEGLTPNQVVGRHVDDLFIAESAMSLALHQALLGFDSDDLLLTEFDERGRPVRIQVQVYPLKVQQRQVGVLRLTRDLALWAPELHEAATGYPTAASDAVAPLEDGAAVLSGRSEYADDLRLKLQQLAPQRGPFLIWGPPGSGRNSYARLLHQSSGSEPLLTCDFNYRSPTAQEIALLGVDSAVGLWQQASQGTLILDDVHLASPRLQNRLVELLGQEHAPRCVLLLPGDPWEAVASGNLHPGLVERCILHMELRSLSRRSEDLPQICQYLLLRINHKSRSRVFGLTPLCKEALQSYPWPGGLRELYAVLEGAVALAVGAVITPDLLPPQLHLVVQGLLNHAPLPEPFPVSYDPRRFTAPIFGGWQGTLPEPRAEHQESLDFLEEELAETAPPDYLEELYQEQEWLAAPVEHEEQLLQHQEERGTQGTTLEEDSEADAYLEEEGLPFFSPAPIFSAIEIGHQLAAPPPVPLQQRRYGEMERGMIMDTLLVHDHDLAAAAKSLHMSEVSLRRRLELYGIDVEEQS